MIRRLFFAAIAAGVLAGVIISAVHQVTTVPIILHAETYEASNRTDQAPLALVRATWIAPMASDDGLLHQAHGAANDGHVAGGAWAPEDGFERILYTGLTTVLMGIGFALLLVAGMAMRGEAVNARRGVLWGAAGFVAFTLAPTLGLPPEMPGAAAADIVARQVWWLAAAITAAGGLWLLVFTEGLRWKVLGAVIMALPHVAGAPHPPELTPGGAPPELAAQFAATTIVTSALFWAMLGGFAGHFFGRSAPAE